MSELTTLSIFTGLGVDLAAPRVIDIDIQEIALSLARESRFLGRTRGFYSVAQHSVLVSLLCPTYPVEGLLHDAHEAFFGDLPRPVKVLLEQIAPGAWKKIVAPVQQAICARFGINDPDDLAEVKQADDILLATEFRDLMAGGDLSTRQLPPPLVAAIVPAGETEARQMFLERFHQLVPF